MEKLTIYDFSHFEKFEAMYNFFNTNIFDYITYIGLSSYDAAIHATIYLLFAKWFQRNKEKEEYIHKFENVFIYTNTYYPKNNQFHEESEARLKSDILWLERNKKIFNKNIQNEIYKILEYTRKWKYQISGTNNIILLDTFLLEKKNDIENVIIKMKGK